MRWYFSLDGDVVVVRARAEAGRMLGDLCEELRAGEEIFGVSYAALRLAGGGSIEVSAAGRGRIGSME